MYLTHLFANVFRGHINISDNYDYISNVVHSYVCMYLFFFFLLYFSLLVLFVTKKFVLFSLIIVESLFSFVAHCFSHNYLYTIFLSILMYICIVCSQVCILHLVVVTCINKKTFSLSFFNPQIKCILSWQ